MSTTNKVTPAPVSRLTSDVSKYQIWTRVLEMPA